MFHWINRFSSEVSSLSGSLIMEKISTLGTPTCATLPNSGKQQPTPKDEGDYGLPDSKLRKLLSEQEENEISNQDQSKNNEPSLDNDENQNGSEENLNNSEIEKEELGKSDDESKESKENLKTDEENEKKVEESVEKQGQSNEREIKENDTDNGKEAEDFNLYDDIEDDSDDDKLHIVENEENVQPQVISKQSSDDQCPFDCCALGLTHTLAKMNDKENHDAFKRAHEIKCSILLRAGRPELLQSIELDEIWKNFQNEDLNEEILSMRNQELSNLESAASAVKPIVQMENTSHMEIINAHAIAAGESNVKKFWKERSEREKPVESSRDIQQQENSINQAVNKSEDGRMKMKRLSSFTESSFQRLPPKKRDRLYRPWMDLSYQAGLLRAEEANNMHYSAKVIDLSKHRRNSVGEGKGTEGVDKNFRCAPDKATLLEKYDHVVALENGNLVYMCKTCFTTLKSEEEIIAHRSCQGVTKSMHCYLCRQDFTMENYREHLEHHDAHPAALKCKLCGVVFDNFVQKSNHQKTVHRIEHRDKDAALSIGNKDVPYICYLCGQDFNFNSKAALSHTLTHVNGYPFPCDFCNNWFKGIETAVTRFVLRRNGGNMFLCSVDPFLYMGLFSNNTAGNTTQ